MQRDEGSGRGARRTLVAIVVAAAAVAIDQLTKHWAVSRLSAGESVSFWGGQLHLARNSGVAFGLLPDGGWAAFVAFGLLLMIGRRYWRSPSPVEAAAAGLLVGGAAGNLIDRLFRGDGGLGHVVDFIDVGWWPTWNVADACLAIAGVLLLAAGRTATALRAGPQ